MHKFNFAYIHKNILKINREKILYITAYFSEENFKYVNENSVYLGITNSSTAL